MPFSLRRKKDKLRFKDTSTPTKKVIPSKRPNSTSKLSNPSPFAVDKSSIDDVGNKTEPILQLNGKSYDNNQNQSTSSLPKHHIYTPKIKSIRSHNSPNRSFLNSKHPRASVSSSSAHSIHSSNSILNDADDNDETGNNLNDDSVLKFEPMKPATVDLPYIKPTRSNATSRKSFESGSAKKIEQHLANTESTYDDSTNNNSHSGIFSSFIHAAQNAASHFTSSSNHDLKSHPPPQVSQSQPLQPPLAQPSSSSGNNPDDTTQVYNNNNSSFMQQLDSLLFNNQSSTNQLQPPKSPENEQNSIQSQPLSTHAMEVVFQPLRKTTVQTLGKGELTLEDLGFNDISNIRKSSIEREKSIRNSIDNSVELQGNDKLSHSNNNNNNIGNGVNHLPNSIPYINVKPSSSTSVVSPSTQIQSGLVTLPPTQTRSSPPPSGVHPLTKTTTNTTATSPSLGTPITPPKLSIDHAVINRSEIAQPHEDINNSNHHRSLPTAEDLKDQIHDSFLRSKSSEAIHTIRSRSQTSNLHRSLSPMFKPNKSLQHILNNNEKSKHYSLISNTTLNSDTANPTGTGTATTTAGTATTGTTTGALTTINGTVHPHRRSFSSGIDIDDTISKNTTTATDNGIVAPLSTTTSSIELKNVSFANEKRNNEFHQLFKKISPREKLIDDFSCALQREILNQGRLYISESHICFKSNILGWITNIIIPLQEIVQIEKKTTAGLFHNGITIQTLHLKYSFVSFLARDLTFELILNIWTQLVRGGEDHEHLEYNQLSREGSYEDEYNESDDYEDTSDEFTSDDDNDDEAHGAGHKQTRHRKRNRSISRHQPTEPDHKELPNEVKLIDDLIPAPLNKVFKLITQDVDKLQDIIQNSNDKFQDFTQLKKFDKDNKRSFSYKKSNGNGNGNGGSGDKAEYEINQSLEYKNLSKFIEIKSFLKTSQVPNLTIINTIYLCWGPKNSTRLIVYSFNNWSTKSWIKKAVEKNFKIDQKFIFQSILAKMVEYFQNETSGGDDDDDDIQGDISDEGEDLEQDDDTNNHHAQDPNDTHDTKRDNDSINSSDEFDVNKDSNDDSKPSESNLPTVGPKQHEPTESDYKNKQGDVIITDEVINAPLGTIYTILFGDDSKYLTQIIQAQKNYSISEISKFNNKKRSYQYVKPLGGPVGPKETKCLITETIEHFDLNKFIQVIQTTLSPDVPSGNSFSVVTSFYLSWSENNSTRLQVVTNVNWTGRSWIKSAIEKGTFDGQRESIGILLTQIRNLLQSSQSGGGSNKRKKSKRKNGKKVTKRSKPVEVKQIPENTVQETNFQKFIKSLPEIEFTNPLHLLGIFVIFVLFIYSIRHGSGGNNDKHVVLKDVTKIRLDGNDYLIMPILDDVLKDESLHKRKEIEIWDWINQRSNKIDKNRNKHKDLKYDEENLKEVLALAEQHLQKLKSQLE